MPLPTHDQPWPPHDTQRPRELYDAWSAWYSGDPEELSRVYGGTVGGHEFYRDHDRTGVLGRAWSAVVRWFWGQPSTPGQAPSRLHVPLASDIAEASAQLLFEELPAITVGSQERLDEITEEADLHATLLEAAEVCAAYGGVYLRVSWDTSVAGVPLVDAITPEAAAPEWAHGRLSAVTFWRVLTDDHGQVWRHLERHEPGTVYHGLYQGPRDKLGRPVPLDDRPETAPLAEQVDADGAIPTGAPGLAAVYVPNVKPNRQIRGSPLGRSDYAGVEQLMDQLDEIWSSWAREHRLAKARAVVPNALLQDQGAGKGAWFDAEQELFTGLEMLPGTDTSPSNMVQLVQPEIRVEQHARTVTELATQIIRGAGYSPGTFGEQGDGQAVTATEVHARERRTHQTRARKIGYWKSALAQLVEAMLAVDAEVFGSGVTPERPAIEWPDAMTPDPEALSRTLTGIANAEAASVRTKVAMLHPDWDEAAVSEEVERIRSERTGEADPFADASSLTDLPEDTRG